MSGTLLRAESRHFIKQPLIYNVHIIRAWYANLTTAFTDTGKHAYIAIATIRKATKGPD